jgi:arylsulfatase A
MPAPNIVLIVADDMGYGDFSFINGGLNRTPTLDRLAAEGVVMTQHYAGSAVCAPSRASLLTGRYPHRTGAVDTLDGRGLDRLALRETTLADCLRASGYATGLVGKWHLGALDPRFHPSARGFDETACFRGGWQDYYQWRLDRNGSFEPADGRYLTDVFTDEALSFVGRHAAEPFFLHLTYNAPHFPFQAPDDLIAPYRATGRFTEGVSSIYAMIERMDQGIGRLLEELERLGVADNTLFMFTSDNGPQFGGEGDMCTNRFNSNWAGAKGSVLEGGIRVPMLLRWPEGLQPDTRCDAMAHYTDWLPTLLSVTGASRRPELPLDGVDILPAIRGEGDQVPSRRFWQWNRYTPVIESNAAIRDGDWKLVRPAIAESMNLSRADLEMDSGLKYHPERYSDICRDPEPERTIPEPPAPALYNIATDPGETNDLAATEPARVRALLTRLEAWFEDVEADRRTIAD